MKNLGIVITDGVGFRNFVLSDFLTEARKSFGQIVIFSCVPKSAYNELNLKCKIVELDIFEETFKTWFFRKAKEVAHLQLHATQNFGIQDNLKTTYSKQNNPRGFTTRLLHKISRYATSEEIIQKYNWFQNQTFRSEGIVEEYRNLLSDNKISFLLFSHQRPPYIAPLIYVAQKLKIKTATFIFSWDNLASKGRMAGNFDYYLVWSNLMKSELLEFYKSIFPSQVSVVGTPQFEPYILARYGYSKDNLIEKFELIKDNPILLFTCNDTSSENDPLYLDILCKFIKEGALTSNVNLIVRTSPAEDSSRFQRFKKKYPFIKWNHPKWLLTRTNHQEVWSQRIPTTEDVNDLKSLLNHCDVCINVLSTITIDAFLFDKSVINPVFGNEENKMFDDQKFLKYRHLSYLVESGASQIVKNERQFLNAINSVLEKKVNKEKERKEFVALQIGKSLQGTSKRIAQKLEEWT